MHHAELTGEIAVSLTANTGLSGNHMGPTVLTEAPQAIDGYNGAVSQTVPTLGVNCGMSTGRQGVLTAPPERA